jgi:hypothetical protein
MKRIAACLLGLSLLLLNGCTITFRPPAPLSLSDGSYQSTTDSQLAIAVDAGGGKHTAHVECLTATGLSCRVIYEATHSGEVSAHHLYVPSSTYSFRNPDVAVTDSGLAVVAWQNCPEGDPNTRLCSTWFVRSDDLSALHVLEAGTHSLSAPLLVSRGAVIYAVIEVTNGAVGSGLRYCKVSAPANPCYWASVQPDPGSDDSVRRTQAAAVVSSGGSLHVVWLAVAGSNKSAQYNDNYGALSADMDHWLSIVSGPFLPPAMAMETNDAHLYIALATDETTSDQLSLFYCSPQNCAGNGGTALVDLPPAKHWVFLGKPSITAGLDRAYGTFSASNTDHPSQKDIYDFNYLAGPAAPAVTRTYPTTLAAGSNACDPVVVLVAGWETIGWHICGFPPSRSDIYVYDPGHGGRIIHSTNFAGRGGLDMAASGEYVGGIWNEVQGDGRVATWLAYNSYLVMVPVIRK